MTGKIRIIGGAWRGRKLEVMTRPGLRPSGDRSRETLFNWLGPLIHGRHCLDLFAGTGVLGLEAVSRGAASATLVERDDRVAELIERQIARWPDRERITVVRADALRWLKRQRGHYELIFIDPPHGKGLQLRALEGLLKSGLIAPDARICVEYGIREGWTGQDPDWFKRHFSILKSGRFGQVEISLLQSSTL